MVKKIDPVHNWKKLSPSDGHYFFGYYDRNPWNHFHHPPSGDESTADQTAAGVRQSYRSGYKS